MSIASSLHRFTSLRVNLPRVRSWLIPLARLATLPAVWKRILHHETRPKLQFIPGAMLAGVIPIAVMYAGSEDVKGITKHADQLYDNNKMQELYNYMMQYKDIQAVEIQWRCSRACYKLSILPSVDKNEAKRLAHACLDFASQAVQLDNNNFQCHKWMGIAYSTVGDHEGTKTKIQNAYKVKEHFERAIQLNPQDPTVKHLLGRWCFAICDVSWVQRQIASAIFATPPSSSYEEALKNFEQAEQTEPGFYSPNWLYLGKVHLKLGQPDKARQWLQKAANYHPKNQEDVESKREAEELLKKLK